ncbi:MAG TPA: hypothetical protein VNT42_00735 [Sphingomonas sp.]|nr:hypothetical protein [Sphingomonas sp.]
MARKPSRAIRLIGIAALLWNLLGLFALGMNTYVTYEMPEMLTPIERAMADATPVSTVVGGFVAVASGILGSIGLIFFRGWSLPLFIFSLMAVIVQGVGIFLTARSMGVVLSAASTLTQTSVFIVAVILILYAAQARAVGALR